MSQVNSLISKFENISQGDQSSSDLQRVRVKRYSMPLRQSTLHFKSTQQDNHSAKLSAMLSAAIKQQAATPPLDIEESDTIIVDLSESNPRAPLPTPSESATDVSSQASAPINNKQTSRNFSKRVSRSVKNDSKDTLVNSDDANIDYQQHRSVSGETLVPATAASPSSILKTGIDALNLNWNISHVFGNGSKEALLAQNNKEDDAQSTISVQEENEQERMERQAAKKAKMEENAKKWAERNKAAEEKATRRSSRASLLVSKAGEVVSDIASSVIGKKSGKDKLSEFKPSDRKRSNSENRSADADVMEEQPEKKQKVGHSESLSAAARAIRNRAPKDKKWLISGLYAGQARTFNPQLSGSKNKRKNETHEDAKPENKILPLPMFAGERLLNSGRDFKLPFDIFSPLPPGQPKPDEWKKVNKSVFIGDAAAEWRTSKLLEQSTCLCTPDNGCDHNCMNRYMYYECDDKNCNLASEQCGNRAFEGLRQRVKKGGKYSIGVEVIKTKDRGYGVRSNRTFEPHQVIVEYTGEILTQEECESRMRTIYKANECYYLMAFDQNMIIDATRGSIARFVNHSCEPNCRMEKWTVGGKPRMALFAGDRGIMTGEELTYDYNFDPYSQKNVQECRCGAANCRGVLGPRSKEDKKRVSPSADAPSEKGKKESKLAGAKRKIAEVLEESTSRLNKKRKTTSDDGLLKKNNKSVVIRKTSTTLVKSSSTRKASGIVVRQPSKLKRMISDGKNKAQRGKRVVSTSSVSSKKALIAKDSASEKSVPSRAGSFKAKAKTIRKTVVKSVSSK